MKSSYNVAYDSDKAINNVDQFDGVSQSSYEQALKPKLRKMGPVKTFFAVIKAYCAINVLLLPRSFVNGGYLVAPLAMIVACFFESLSAARLASVAHRYDIYSYPLLVEKAIGKTGFHIARICIALAHWQFVIGQTTFTLKSLQSTVGAWSGTTTPLWVFALAVWVIYTPLVWVRTMETFSKAFIFAVAMIGLGVVTTTVYAVMLIQEQEGAPGPGYEPVNNEMYWSAIGFAFFMFEGIGCLLPVMRETEKPE